MKKGLLLLTPLLFLAGCALPMPLKVASWALDGISYLATNKSIAENGLSIITKKDCSLMRPLKGEPICIGNNYDISQVLKNAVASTSVNDQGVHVQAKTGLKAEFETAAGPVPDKLSYDASEFSDAWLFMRQQATQAKQAEPEHMTRVRMKALKAATPPVTAVSATGATGPPGYDAGEYSEAWAFIQARDGRNGGLADARPLEKMEKTQQADRKANNDASPETADTVEPTPSPMVKAPGTKPDIQPTAGLYYVIGSLTRLVDIDRLAQRQIDLESRVVVAQVRNRPIYREVVGPFKRSEKQSIRRMIEKSGVTKVWLTFIDPHLWTIAGQAEISALTMVGDQTASLH